MFVRRARPVGSLNRTLFDVALLVCLSAGVGGCSAVSAQQRVGLAAADPHAPVPPVAYRSVVAPYSGQRPVEPLPWREQNQRVAPQANR
jgi:hypothetical protein